MRQSRLWVIWCGPDNFSDLQCDCCIRTAATASSIRSARSQILLHLRQSGQRIRYGQQRQFFLY